MASTNTDVWREYRNLHSCDPGEVAKRVTLNSKRYAEQ